MPRLGLESVLDRNVTSLCPTRECNLIFRIPDQHLFPEPWKADPSGLLGIGGDLHPDRVLMAYRMGIFPWYSEGVPVHWWSPDPRMVLYPSELKVSRSLGKRIRQQPYRLTVDTDFASVVQRCAKIPRPGQDGTWITNAMVDSYNNLHAMGHAHSVEAWLDDELVGGLYGVAVGKVFCGESMFADRPDASKIAFCTVVRQLARWGVELVDCQVHTSHLERFGAREVARMTFLRQLHQGQRSALAVGAWSLDEDLLSAEAWRSKRSSES